MSSLRHKYYFGGYGIEGLVANWDANNVIGTTLYDSSGNENNMTLVGSPVIGDGEVGKTIKFTTGKGTTNLPAPAVFQGLMEESIVFRAKFPNINQSNKPIYMHGDANTYNPPSFPKYIMVMIAGAGDSNAQVIAGKRLVLIINNVANYTVRTTNIDVCDDLYHDFAIRIKSATDTEIYIDGNLVAVTKIDVGGGASNLAISGYIGISKNVYSEANGLTADLDFLKVYNRALSQIEISSL